jgi:hypothetical protein
MDWPGHDCFLRGEACGTVNGSIVGEGAEIICKCKLKDSQGLECMGLDAFWKRIGARRFPALSEAWRSGWGEQNGAKVTIADDSGASIPWQASKRGFRARCPGLLDKNIPK